VRRKLLSFVKAGVSIVLLAVLVERVAAQDGFGPLVDRLGELELGYVLLAVLLQLGAVSLGVVRWQVLLRARGIELPASVLFREYLVGRFAGAFTPSTAGLDVYRAIAVARRTGKKAASTSVIVAEKFLGLFALAIVAMIVIPFGTTFFGPYAIWIAAAIGAGSLAGVIAMLHPSRLLPFAPASVRAKIDAFRCSGLTPPVGAIATSLGVLGHSCAASMFVATALAVGVDAGPVLLFVVGASIVVATLVPISIGGIGVREGVAVALLGTLGVSSGDALLVALLGYAATQVPALAGGLVSALPTRTQRPEEITVS
jgi:uncharacterized membrane protein YbhN (UPF0104 family)